MEQYQVMLKLEVAYNKDQYLDASYSQYIYLTDTNN